MRAFINFAMRSRWHAMAATVGCMVLMMLVPAPSNVALYLLVLTLGGFAVYASGALVALSALRNGGLEGALVAAGALILGALAALVIVQSTVPVVTLSASNWLPALACAMVLRRAPALAGGSGWAGLGSGSPQGLALATAGIAALIAWSGFFALYGDPGTLIEPWLTRQWQGLTEAMRGAGQGTLERPDMKAASAALAEMVLAGLLVGVVLTLLLARWWHAMLDNPGGFGAEFRELRLPRPVAYVAIAALLSALLVGGTGASYSGGVIRIAMVLFVFQGLAVVHSLVHRRAQVAAAAGRRTGTGRGWLVTVYLMLVLVLPYAMVLLALAGFTDSWRDYRKRAGGGV